jgi:hypothetical protein
MVARTPVAGECVSSGVDIVGVVSDDDNAQGIGRWETLGQAFQAYQFPTDNLPLVQRIMDHVGIDHYEGTQSRYFKSIRRDGARHLTVHYGYTSGFETEDAAVMVAGDVDREPHGSHWRVNHPLNDVGEHHRGSSGVAAKKRVAAVCPTCFTELPASGVCDTCSA